MDTSAATKPKSKHLDQPPAAVVELSEVRFAWPDDSAPVIDIEALRRHLDIAGLRQGVVNQMRDTNMVKVKLYNLDGRTLFSTEAKQIGEYESRNAGFLSALQGHPTSELTHRNQFSAFDQMLENLDVLSSYVALRRDPDAPIEGVVEVYTDVTDLLGGIERGQRLVTVSVAAVLTLLYAILFFIVRHADRVIKGQYEQQRQQTERQQKLQPRSCRAAADATPGAAASGFARTVRQLAAASRRVPVR